MNKPKLLLATLFSFTLLLIITAAILSVFSACDIKLFGKFMFDCSEGVAGTKSKEEKPDREIEILLRRIDGLEKHLATQSCAYVEYQKKVVAPPPVDTPEILKKTDLDAWKRKDLGALAGCWILTGSAQEFVPVGCKDEDRGGVSCPVTPSSNAVYCFDNQGSGSVKTEIDQKFCTAPLQAKFNDASQLDFKELSHQICPVGTRRSDGSVFGKIVPSSYRCKLTVDNKAECEVINSTGVTNKITLVRTSDE